MFCLPAGQGRALLRAVRGVVPQPAHCPALGEHLGLDQTPRAVADPLCDPGKLVKSGSLEVAVSQSVGKTDLWRYAKYRQHKSRSHTAPFRFLLHEGKQSASF